MDDKEKDMLSRLDERSKLIMHQISQLGEVIQEKYVSKEEFGPVKNIVYGMCGSLLLAIIGSFVGVILKK